MDYVQGALHEYLTEAISESFENLIFAEVEEVTELETLPDLESAVHIRVDTIHPFESEVIMIINTEFAQDIYMEMLGGDPDDVDEDLLNDALGEIGNTVVGKFLSNVVPEEQEFSLGFPECSKYSSEKDSYQSSDSCRVLKLFLDENILYVVLKQNAAA